MADLTLNYDSKYQNDERTIELFKWTNKNIGRLKKLSIFIFNDQSALQPYKSGKLKIHDELYEKIKLGMIEIEKSESLIKKPYISKIYHKGYIQPSRIYSKAINTLKLEKTINEFADFCKSDFTIDNFKEEKYKEIITNNYNNFIKLCGRSDDDKIDGKIVIDILDEFYASYPKYLKAFNIIYCNLSKTKFIGNNYSTIKQDCKTKKVKKYKYDIILETINIVKNISEDKIVELNTLTVSEIANDFNNTLTKLLG